MNRKIFLMILILYSAHNATCSDLPDFTNTTPSRSFADQRSAQDIIDETSWWHRKKSEIFAALIQKGMDQDFELAQNPLPLPQKEDAKSMAMEPFGWGLDALYCAANPPAAEKSFFEAVSKCFVAKAVGAFPLDTNVQISSDPTKTLDVCLPQGHRDRLTKLGFAEGKPRMPKEMSDNLRDMVGGTALFGSFANLIRRYNPQSDGPIPEGMNPSSAYVIDLLNYGQYPVDPGLDRIGGKAFLCFNASRGYMETQAIRSPSSATWISKDQIDSGAWDNAQRRMMAAMFTHATFNEHLGVAHLAVSATISSLVYKLPQDHPLRRMLHIHTIGAIPVNKYNVRLLLDGENAFFGQISSFNIKEITDIMNDHLSTFNFNTLNPRVDLTKRGMLSDVHSLNYGYAQGALRIWDMTENYVRSYVGHYRDEASLSKDADLKQWYADVRHYIPNGEKTLPEKLNLDALVNVVTGFIYSDSFGHYKAGIDIINWGSWPNYIPARVYSDGSLPRVGQISQTFNLLCATQPTERLTMSASYFSQFALDSSGKAIMDSYAKDLITYQSELNQQAELRSMAQPSQLKTSIYS